MTANLRSPRTRKRIALAALLAALPATWLVAVLGHLGGAGAGAGVTTSFPAATLTPIPPMAISAFGVTTPPSSPAVAAIPPTSQLPIRRSFGRLAKPVVRRSLREVAFRAANGQLWGVGAGGSSNLGISILQGTSPAIASVGGGYEFAFQAPDGRLWVAGPGGSGDLGYRMRAGTSPALVAAGFGYEIAFQSHRGYLKVVGPTPATSKGSLGVQLAPGTSPSMTGLADNQYAVAFESSRDELGIATPEGVTDLGYRMKPGTSPSIAAVGVGYVIAFQSSNDRLWTVDDTGLPSLPLGLTYLGEHVAPHTSPAVAALGSGYEIAISGATNTVWTISDTPSTRFHPTSTDLDLRIRADTSPSISAWGTWYEIAFQSNRGRLWGVLSEHL